MDSICTLIKVCLVSVATFISVKLGILGPLLLFLLIAIIVDYISGMVAASVQGKLNSKKGIKGILKKLGYVFAVIVALIADELIIVITAKFGVQLAATATCGLLTTIWLTLNELLSILENIGRMGVPLPKKLKQVIELLKDTVDDEKTDPEK
ncbi:phage holin family protein [Paludicola sp. MB14-C6]|uniref:phage holin family protein n=1 Tax=Paludihabitans sp. MB14-C6 TaxID=3070656 RepID=UPI0027DB3571|nr:phage holin family protein [Paludicola sp. MB14-C6]WMJ24369.1 phage holin family protein [Paludicola sp. MB14-C6]